MYNKIRLLCFWSISCSLQSSCQIYKFFPVLYLGWFLNQLIACHTLSYTCRIPQTYLWMDFEKLLWKFVVKTILLFWLLVLTWANLLSLPLFVTYSFVCFMWKLSSFRMWKQQYDANFSVNWFKWVPIRDC